MNNNIKNPNILYSKAIQAVAQLLQSVASEDQPDRDEVMLLRSIIQLLQKEKIQQNHNFQKEVYWNTQSHLQPIEGGVA